MGVTLTSLSVFKYTTADLRYIVFSCRLRVCVLFCGCSCVREHVRVSVQQWLAVASLRGLRAIF